MDKNKNLSGESVSAAAAGEPGWLRRGWEMGKKAAFAGAAVAAAPVVLPPIIVCCGIAVALSVPFAAYLAGLAGVERLMGALLPLAGSRVPMERKRFLDEDGQVFERMLDRPLPNPSGSAPEMVAFVRLGEVSEIVALPFEEETQALGRAAHLGFMTAADPVDQVESSPSHRSLNIIPEESELPAVATIELESAKIANDSTANALESEVHVVATMEVDGAKTDDEISGPGDEVFRDFQGVLALAAEASFAKENLSDTSSVYASALEETVGGDEEALNKEQLWEQLVEIRTIIGCREILSTSLYDELRDMYLLTGINPPASLHDSSDLADLKEGLDLLKSIIGVE